ncbi:hypothetical protein [Streptomyces sp. YIM 121038]|uniref:hypothetical protein n=1 Tax=Streptomyces sp. YIM 121038 TaxID=2136401 RepID=UPI00110FF91D|nr:hypothetical protein [Streptomyces sp. YIM 121038]
MIDLDTNKVILHKVVRRKPFILGESKALARKDVVQMDDRSIRVICHRRPEHFDFLPAGEHVVTLRLSTLQRFLDAVIFVRHREAPYITEELPESFA